MNDGLRTLALVEELLALPAETPWLEFKQNNTDAVMIGRQISALANAARLAEKDTAWLLWGVRDADHAPIGTTFESWLKKQSKQPLELWLAQRLRPAVAVTFKVLDYHGVRLVLLEIPAATGSPVEFDRQAYLRVGSAVTRLAGHSERQKALWAKLQSHAWERGMAAQFLSGDEVLERLEYTAYFSLTGQPLPDNRAGIFDKLCADRVIAPDVGGRWNITNLGAILFARQLSDFAVSLARKAVRLTVYHGSGRADTVTYRREEQKGYALGFAALIDTINGLLPHNEHIGAALREARPLYPAIAIRELVANALIHQDMSITGTGPEIAMFSDRMEMTNPGQPLVQPERFLDFPPRSRNEALAALMRRMGFCEEQGTGIDKVLVAVELHQLPPPDFQAPGESVRTVLYAPRRFAEMTPEERMRACYQHAALRYVSGEKKMTNATLRERLGIEARNGAQASTVIRQCLKAGLIRVADPAYPRSGYVPVWA